MSEPIPTIGGVPSRSEVYLKLIHHIDEAQSLCAIMAHLHNTEDNSMDRLLAKGWLGMSELFRKIRHQITELASNKLN